MGQYNYIITGAGAAGLSLLVHMIRSGQFLHKKILLLEANPKTSNDRTWCFWEEGEGIFEEIVYSQWNRLWFHGDHSRLHDIAPYRYKLIRGIDFYNYCLDLISAAANVTVKYGNVEACISNGSETYVVFEGQKIHADFIFNSIVFEKPLLGSKDFYLLQHFKGWVVKTRTDVFDPLHATLMDFRISQHHGTSFVYVMPFSAREALVEYTLFSEQVLEQEEYDAGLTSYCKKYLSLTNYTIDSEEFGIIPMTNFRFPQHTGNIVYIGTAGGQTKASSGYTFNFIQKQSAAIVHALIHKGNPFVKEPVLSRRFKFYDAVLLNILAKKKLNGRRVFNTLFESNSMKNIFRFLDNETGIAEELAVIRRLPKRLFMKAAIEQL